MYYYAEIDGDCKVVATHPVTEQSTNANYVEITEEQYATGAVLNTYYNKLTGAFEAVDPNMWMGDTEWMRISGTGSGTTGKRLSTELENMKVDIANKANAESLADVATSGSYNDLSDKPEQFAHPATHPASMITGLSEVATSGSYNDLSDKPTIPTIPASLPANGGNADTVDGKHATDFATANHNHDSDYADADHNHDGDYAGATHTHAQSDITGLDTALNGKANATHTHSEYVTNEDFSELETAVNGKANASHTHSQYASASDVAALQTEVDGKADTNHSHSEYAAASHSHTGYAAVSHTHSQYANATDVEALEDEVAGKADASHTHSQYAASGHTHDNFVTNDTYTSGMSGKANASHTHAQSEISGLTAALNEKASASHTHTQYAGSDHTHTDYAPIDHEHTDYALTGHTHLGYSGASASTYKLVYVGVDGNDANNGASQSSPMATVKGAIRKYAENHKFLDIRLLDGTYNEDLGAIGIDTTNLSIRSVSEDKDAVIINMGTQLDLNSGHVRLYNMTLNVTATGVRGISVNASALYAYGIRINLPTDTTMSCVNVYNGALAFLMNCVLNAGTGTSAGAAVYGNQAQLIKAINVTSERTVNVGFHAHNGSDIYYTNTLTATTVKKETYYGKCTVR